MLKLRMISILVIGIISSSCGHVPTKPSIDSGITIIETNEAFFVNNQTSEEYSIPLVMPNTCKLNNKLDKNIIHSNRDWNKVLMYIRLLENEVPEMVREELIKVRESSLKLLEAHGL